MHPNRFLPALIACTLMCAFCVPANAAIIFNITYNDVVNGTGFGFDDPTFGADRQATVTAVTNYLNTVFDENGTIDMTFNQSLTTGMGALASAGPLFFGAPNGYQNGLAFQHATTGVDPAVGVHDASATFNFGYAWNSELDAPTGSEFDLFSVTLHEISHALGFLSLVSASGTSTISGGDPGVFSVLNSFLERGNGTDLFGPGGNYLGTGADLTSNDVFFNGPNATAANGGNRVQMYAPAGFTSGSSISHIQGIANAVMQPSIAPGVQRRAYTAQELGILQDIGWTLDAASIPEPSGLALIIAAGTVISGSRWRKRRVKSTTAAAA